MRSASGPDDDVPGGAAFSSSSNRDPLMFRCLVKDDRNRDRRIQRLDTTILRHAKDRLALPQFLVRRTAALITDEDGRWPFPVPRFNTFTGGWRSSDKRDTGGLQFFV